MNSLIGLFVCLPFCWFHWARFTRWWTIKTGAESNAIEEAFWSTRDLLFELHRIVRLLMPPIPTTLLFPWLVYIVKTNQALPSEVFVRIWLLNILSPADQMLCGEYRLMDRMIQSSVKLACVAGAWKRVRREELARESFLYFSSRALLAPPVFPYTARRILLKHLSRRLWKTGA